MTTRANPTDVIQDELREGLAIEFLADHGIVDGFDGDRSYPVLVDPNAVLAAMSDAVQYALQAAQHRQEGVAGMRITPMSREEMNTAFDELHGCMIRRPGETCEVRKEFLAVALTALDDRISPARAALDRNQLAGEKDA